MTPLTHARVWDDIAQDFRDRADRNALRGLPLEAENWVSMSRFAHGVADAYRRHARGTAIEPPDPQGLPALLERQAQEGRRELAAAREPDRSFDVVTDPPPVAPLPLRPELDE